MANFAYALGGNHRFELRSIYTDLSTSEGRFQEGFFSGRRAGHQRRSGPLEQRQRDASHGRRTAKVP